MNTPEPGPGPGNDLLWPRVAGLEPWLRAVSLTSLGYFAAAKLGLLLALPSGFASPLWPAAGLAFLLALRWGWAALPGLAMGSLASNLTAGAGGGALFAWPEPGSPYLALAAVALGAAAQAGLSAMLLRQLLAGVPQGPLTLWTIVRAVFRTGPVACLVNAAVAALLLPSFTILPFSERPAAALVWWLGDALGVLAVLPVALWMLRMPAAEPGRAFWRQYQTALVCLSIVAAGWLLTVGIGRLQTAAITSRQASDARELQHHVQSHVDRALLMLETFRAFFETTTGVGEEQFRRFAAPWIGKDSNVDSVAWGLRLFQQDRAAYEAQPPGLGQPLPVRERLDHQFVSAGLRPEYWPITLVTPELHRPIQGFDLASEPQRRAVLERAMRQDAPAVSGPLQARNPATGEAHDFVLMVRRVDGFPPAFIAASLRLRPLLEQELQSLPLGLPPGAAFTLHPPDGGAPLRYWLDATGGLDGTAAAALSPAISLPLAIADRDWRLDIALPPRNAALFASAAWWLGQVMPQLFAVLLTLAIVNGALRAHHTRQLESTLSRLAGGAPSVPVQPQHHGAELLSQPFAVHYAPEIHLHSGLMSGIHVAPRWADASPAAAEWLGWARQQGSEARLCRELLDTVLDDSRQWPLRRGESFHFCLPVGLAPASDSVWQQHLLSTLGARRLPGRRLCLVLGEAELVAADAATLARLAPLRDAGVRIALGGLGTAQDTLAALPQLPVDRLILDARLTAGAIEDARLAEFIRVLCQIADGRGMEVVADGLARPLAADRLKALGCGHAAGPLFAPLGNAVAVSVALLDPKPHWSESA